MRRVFDKCDSVYRHQIIHRSLIMSVAFHQLPNIQRMEILGWNFTRTIFSSSSVLHFIPVGLFVCCFFFFCVIWEFQALWSLIRSGRMEKLFAPSKHRYHSTKIKSQLTGCVCVFGDWKIGWAGIPNFSGFCRFIPQTQFLYVSPLAYFLS